MRLTQAEADIVDRTARDCGAQSGIEWKRILDLLEENSQLRGCLTMKDEPAEVRRNSDGTLDEIVGHGFFHLEQMSDDTWWMRLTTAHGDVDCTLYCKRKGRKKIRAVCEDFQEPKADYALTITARERP